jgi:phage baseplate assembly protein gpV
MDFRERFYDAEEVQRVAMDGRLSRVWTAMPGIITKVNLAHQTVEVQPAIQAQQSYPDGTSKHVTLPIVPDVPIMFPSGGGYTLTFPVAVGDHCLLHFASRCIDGWWDTGKVQPAMDKRMHDLSDAFATVGPRHRQGVPGNISSKTTTLRTDDGTLVIEMDQTNGAINISTPTTVNLTTKSANITTESATVTASDHMTIDTPHLNVTGSINSAGNIITDGDVITRINNVALSTHEHGGVMPGGGNTASPVPGT